jgi:general stress protein 26
LYFNIRGALRGQISSFDTRRILGSDLVFQHSPHVEIQDLTPQQLTPSSSGAQSAGLVSAEGQTGPRLAQSSCEVVMSTELEKLYTLIEDIDTAMMTTRRTDGHLRARAMANQKRAAGADLWFVTADGTEKVADLTNDPHLNLSYYRDSNREWVSVSGVATVTRDRAKIRELYAEDWRMWFGKEGDPRDGTPDDPRIVLIGVTVHAAEFLEINKPRPVLLYELVKGWVTGSEPELGEMHALNEPRRPVGTNS